MYALVKSGRWKSKKLLGSKGGRKADIYAASRVDMNQLQVYQCFRDEAIHLCKKEYNEIDEK